MTPHKYSNGREAKKGDAVIFMVMNSETTVEILAGTVFLPDGAAWPNPYIGVVVAGRLDPFYLADNEYTPDKVDKSVLALPTCRAVRAIYHAEDAFRSIDAPLAAQWDEAVPRGSGSTGVATHELEVSELPPQSHTMSSDIQAGTVTCSPQSSP